MKHFFTTGLLFCLPLWLFAQITIVTTNTNVSCFGGNNGTATAIPSGGIEPYAYIWSTGASTNQVSGLSLGTYYVTVTDNSGNTAAKSVIITQPPLLGTTLNGQPQICPQVPDGFAYCIPTGGSNPFTFSWNNGIHTQLNNYLTANTYTVTVTDTKGCTATGAYTVGFLGIGLYLITDAEAAICPLPYNGSANVTALSGNGPYSYQWNNGATTTTIDSLFPGNYEVTVSDVNGCSASSIVTVGMENVDSSIVQILIPQCVGQTYQFESSVGYHVYTWTISDPMDSIIAGYGTNRIQVKWGGQGQKEISVSMTDTITQCATGTAYKVGVYVCALETKESTLNKLTVTPNPFDQYIGIHQNGLELPKANAQLFNLQGKLVLEQMLEDKSMLMDSKNLPSGLYLLKLADGRSSRVWKVLKE